MSSLSEKISPVIDRLIDRRIFLYSAGASLSLGIQVGLHNAQNPNRNLDFNDKSIFPSNNYLKGLDRELALLSFKRLTSTAQLYLAINKDGEISPELISQDVKRFGFARRLLINASIYATEKTQADKNNGVMSPEGEIVLIYGSIDEQRAADDVSYILKSETDFAGNLIKKYSKQYSTEDLEVLITAHDMFIHFSKIIEDTKMGLIA